VSSVRQPSTYSWRTLQSLSRTCSRWSSSWQLLLESRPGCRQLGVVIVSWQCDKAQVLCSRMSTLLAGTSLSKLWGSITPWRQPDKLDLESQLGPAGPHFYVVSCKQSALWKDTSCWVVERTSCGICQGLIVSQRFKLQEPVGSTPASKTKAISKGSSGVHYSPSFPNVFCLNQAKNPRPDQWRVTSKIPSPRRTDEDTTMEPPFTQANKLLFWFWLANHAPNFTWENKFYVSVYIKW
jgi:hypothetical protein